MELDATKSINELELENQELKNEIAKQKESYEQQIQTLKLENKISTFDLEKKNLSLNHEIELLKMKAQFGANPKDSIGSRFMPADLEKWEKKYERK